MIEAFMGGLFVGIVVGALLSFVIMKWEQRGAPTLPIPAGQEVDK